MQSTRLEGEPALIWTGKIMLEGMLVTPDPSESRSAIVIASLGSTTLHSGYRRMARRFAAEGFIVLAADLLTADEQQVDSRTGHYRSDIDLLAERVRGVVNWLHRQTSDKYRVVFFGSGRVGAAGLLAAASDPGLFALLAAAAARTDLVSDALPDVLAPALLLIPESDPVLLNATTRATTTMKCEKRLVVLRDATGMIDDDRTVDVITDHALAWSHEHMSQLTGAL